MMTTESGTLRLSAQEWDHWYQTSRPTVVSHKEAERFYTHVAPQLGRNAVDLACGAGQWTRQLAAGGRPRAATTSLPKRSARPAPQAPATV